ncbi:MAG: hypothetical protein KDI03_20335 [Anaerolineae bacterium]|nr:hypothetical protein [Anaerolineae bacterium]
MTMKALQRRVEGIEARQQVTRFPAFISVPTVEDIPAALEGWPADAVRSVKVFIGISPHDWDEVEP